MSSCAQVPRTTRTVREVTKGVTGVAPFAGACYCAAREGGQGGFAGEAPGLAVTCLTARAVVRVMASRRWPRFGVGGWKGLGLLLGLVAFALLLGLDTPLSRHGAWGDRPARAAAATALMAIWWLTEALPIYVTACVPLVLFPWFGVFGRGVGEDLVQTVLPYVHPYIFLFLGGMCIAAAMQQWGLHRRIALSVMRLLGSEPRRLLFGMIAATAFVSMWMSNTATAAMMVPIGMALIRELEERSGGRRLVRFGGAIMLAIAYAANVGGIGTKIGTAPNAQFAGFLERLGTEVSFLGFMAVGLPFVMLFVPVIWGVLWREGRADAPPGDLGAGAVAEEIRRLGPTRREEWVVLGVFACAAALWISGQPIARALRPEVTSFTVTAAQVEAVVAMVAALVLVSWRSGGRQVLERRSLASVPWETLLLLGGSFSMADAIEQSGLSHWLAGELHVVRDLGGFTQVLIASFATVALSAVASNTATIAVMLSVLHRAAAGPEVATVLFAATLAASCDFALPAGTPPNAIVFGSGYVTVPKMARIGVTLDVAAALLIAVWCWWVVPLVL
jgi:sodium-dependent dicarboxylate transporter 2/3/5